MRTFLDAAVLVGASAWAGPSFVDLNALNPPAGRRACGGAVKPGGSAETWVSYGGANGTGILAEQLVYSPQANSWSSTASALPSRERHSLAYDPVHDRYAIVGGVTGSSVQDTVFLLDGVSLTASTPTLPATRPSARADAMLHWVPPLGRFLYFGGRTGVMAATHANDLWTLDVGDGGVTWSSVTATGTPPSARGGVCSAWDPDHQQVLLFGGEASSMMNDTWTFTPDGGVWTQLTVTGSVPSPRGFAACAWDARLKQLVLYGGQVTGTPLGGLYSFDPVTNVWTAYTPATTPGTLARAAAEYSPALGGTIVFAGSDTLTTYTQGTWLLRFNQPPVADAGRTSPSARGLSSPSPARAATPTRTPSSGTPGPR